MLHHLNLILHLQCVKHNKWVSWNGYPVENSNSPTLRNLRQKHLSSDAQDEVRMSQQEELPVGLGFNHNIMLHALQNCVLQFLSRLLSPSESPTICLNFMKTSKRQLFKSSHCGTWQLVIVKDVRAEGPSIQASLLFYSSETKSLSELPQMQCFQLVTPHSWPK